jgi:hypothetical protein
VNVSDASSGPDASTLTDQSRATTDTTDRSEPMTEDARPDETDRSETTPTAVASTLADISHVNPHTDRTFGTTQTYGRGRVIAADGGEAASSGEETLEDVDHTPADDVDGAQGTFDRGKAAPDDEPDDE